LSSADTALSGRPPSPPLPETPVHVDHDVHRRGSLVRHSRRLENEAPREWRKRPGEEGERLLARTLALARRQLMILGVRRLRPDLIVRSSQTKETETIHVFGVDCLCVTLDALIRLKRAAGRRKDLEAIAELEAIREEREKTGLR
jgi:hypothetical protein